ncbi:hypothetical protein CEXT_2991, partial [Caerostris extrusa]
EELLAVLCLIDNGWCRSQRQVYIHVRSRRQIGNISGVAGTTQEPLGGLFPCRVNTNRRHQLPSSISPAGVWSSLDCLYHILGVV